MEIQGANVKQTRVTSKQRMKKRVNSWNSWTKYGRITGIFFGGSNNGDVWVFPKIMGKPPNHPLNNSVFHYFHHPFWDTPIFGNIRMDILQ